MICQYTGNKNDLPEWAKDCLVPEEAIVRLPGLPPITNRANTLLVRPGDYIVARRDGVIDIIRRETAAAM